MSNPIRLYMSMSLDGYIAGPEDRPGQELGRGGGRLFNCSTTGSPTAPADRSIARRWQPAR